MIVSPAAKPAAGANADRPRYDQSMFATLAGGYPRPAPPDDPAAPDPGLAAVLAAQVEAGLELVSDGLVHRPEPYGEALGASLVAAWRATAIATDRPTKLAVLGPYSAGTVDALPGGATEALAAALVTAAGALAAAGCPVLEIHEPGAVGIRHDAAERARFGAAHRRLAGELAAATAAAHPGLHLCLAITGGNADAAGPETILAAPYASYLFDLVDGPDNWRLVTAVPGSRGIVCGVGDASGQGRTRLEEVVFAARYAASSGGRGLDRVGLAPSGSLAGLDPERARTVLELVGGAARLLAAGPGAALRHLDPRAVDARSAALGMYRQERGRSRRP